MKFTLADEIIGDLSRVPLAVADQHATVSYLAGLQRLRGLIDALEVEAARRLHELTHAAPTELAKATLRHARAGERIHERSATLTAVPSLAAPLGSGALQAAHVDTVTKVMRTIEAKHAGAFTAALPNLVAEAAAARATPMTLPAR